MLQMIVESMVCQEVKKKKREINREIESAQPIEINRGIETVKPTEISKEIEST